MNRSVVTHHCMAWWRSEQATSRWTAGSARLWRFGRGGTRGAGAAAPYGPAELSQLEPHQKAVGHHHGHRMPMKPRPQPALIQIPAHLSVDFLVELLDGIPAMGVAASSSSVAVADMLLQ
jgi:hypothetical protein